MSSTNNEKIEERRGGRFEFSQVGTGIMLLNVRHERAFRPFL